MIFLDSGATSLQKPAQVAAAMTWAMGRCASPGRGSYRQAEEAARAAFQCRVLAAQMFDAEPEQVVFTMNATHALNLAIKTLVAPGGSALISGFEHNAVTRPLYALRARVRIAGRKLFDPADTLHAFREGLDFHPDAVICTHVSNVFGYRLPIEEIALLCREQNVPLIIDAAQSAGHCPLSLRGLGAAFIAMPGHKGLYGPQGTGILLCGHSLKPLMEGGTGSLSRQQEMPDFPPDAGEAGTHNVPGICGLTEGLRFVQRKGTAELLRHERELLALALDSLDGADGIHCFHGGAQTGVLSLTVDGLDCETTAQKLAEQDVAVRAGLHCAPLAHESAGTLDSGTVRLSFSAFNTRNEILQAASWIRALVNN